MTARPQTAKGVAIIGLALCLPPLAAGQGLPRYRATALGPGTNLQSITPSGQALFGDVNGRSALYDPASGLRFLPSTYHAGGLNDDGDAWGYNFQNRALIWRRQTNTYTEYFHPFGGGSARLTGANTSGLAVGQLDAITGLGTPVRWLTPTTGELLMDSTGANPAVYVQAIRESGHALGSDGPNNGCIWDPGTNIARIIRPNNRKVFLGGMAENGWIAATPNDGVLGGAVPVESYIVSTAGAVLHRINPYAGRSIALWQVDASGWASGTSLLHNGVSMSSKAIIWSPNTGIIEIQNQVDNPPSGMVLEHCKRSESGAILAEGPIFDGPNGPARQMYYLEPVPEPGSVLILTAGLVAMRRRRRSST